MAPEGRYLAQGEQYERSLVHFRMGQVQLAPTPGPTCIPDLAAAEIEDIDVELPRAPVAAQPAPCAALDALERPQQSCGAYGPLDLHNSVEVTWLSAQPDRRGRVERRESQDSKTIRSKFVHCTSKSRVRGAPRSLQIRAKGEQD